MAMADPRVVTIDLGSISSRDDFQRELGRHFSIPPDHAHLWLSLTMALFEASQSGPLHLRLVRFAELEQRMPRYARHLHRLVESVARFAGRRLSIERDGRALAIVPVAALRACCDRKPQQGPMRDVPCPCDEEGTCRCEPSEDRPYAVIALVPIPHPTAAQIQAARELCHRAGTVMETRERLQKGGLTCLAGESLPEDRVPWQARLDASGLAYTVEPTRTVRRVVPRRLG